MGGICPDFFEVRYKKPLGIGRRLPRSLCQIESGPSTYGTRMLRGVPPLTSLHSSYPLSPQCATVEANEWIVRERRDLRRQWYIVHLYSNLHIIMLCQVFDEFPTRHSPQIPAYVQAPFLYTNSYYHDLSYQLVSQPTQHGVHHRHTDDVMLTCTYLAQVQRGGGAQTDRLSMQQRPRTTNAGTHPKRSHRRLSSPFWYPGLGATPDQVYCTHPYCPVKN